MRRIWWLLALLLGSFACRPDDPGEAAGPELLQMGADQVVMGMVMHLSREGQRKARLLADTAYLYEDLNESRYRNFKLIFFDDAGKELSEVTGVSGIYYDISGDIEATGAIIVIDRRENQRLETDRIYYSAADDELTGDRPFVYYDDNTVHRGDRFISDPGLDAIRSYNPSGVSQGLRAPGARVAPGSQDDTASVAEATGTDPAPAAAAPGSAVSAQDSIVASSDSAGLPQDTASLAQDSTASAPDTAGAAPDPPDSSLAQPPDQVRSDSSLASARSAVRNRRR